MNKAIKKDQRAKVLEPIFDALAEHHTGAEWFGEALESLGKNARDFEPKKVAALYTKVVEGSEDKDVQAQALFHGARALAKEDPKTSAAFLARIGDEFGNTHYFTMAQSLSVTAADVEQGKTAPASTARPSMASASTSRTTAARSWPSTSTGSGDRPAWAGCLT